MSIWIATTQCRVHGGIVISIETVKKSIPLRGSHICACSKVSEFAKIPPETLGELDEAITAEFASIVEAST